VQFHQRFVHFLHFQLKNEMIINLGRKWNIFAFQFSTKFFNKDFDYHFWSTI